MAKTKRRQLTDKELLRASRLMSIYKRDKNELGYNMSILGEILGGMSASAVSQYLKGKIPMNLPIMIAFCIALKCDIKEIDPDLPFETILSEDEAALLKLYRQKSPKGKELLLGVAESVQAYQALPKPAR